MIVFLGALAVGIHLTLFVLPGSYTYVLLYIRSPADLFNIIMIKKFII